MLAKAPFVSLGPELSGEGGRGGSGPGECQNPLHGLVQAVDKSQVGLAAPGSRTIAALFPAVLQLTDHVLLSQPGSLHRKPGGLVRYDYVFVFIQDSTQHIHCILHFVCIHTAKSFLCTGTAGEAQTRLHGEFRACVRLFPLPWPLRNRTGPLSASSVARNPDSLSPDTAHMQPAGYGKPRFPAIPCGPGAHLRRPLG